MSIKQKAKQVVRIFAEMAEYDWIQHCDRDMMSDEEILLLEKEIRIQLNRVKRLLK